MSDSALKWSEPRGVTILLASCRLTGVNGPALLTGIRFSNCASGAHVKYEKAHPLAAAALPTVGHSFYSMTALDSCATLRGPESAGRGGVSHRCVLSSDASGLPDARIPAGDSLMFEEIHTGWPRRGLPKVRPQLPRLVDGARPQPRRLKVRVQHRRQRLHTLRVRLPQPYLVRDHLRSRRPEC